MRGAWVLSLLEINQEPDLGVVARSGSRALDGTDVRPSGCRGPVCSSHTSRDSRSRGGTAPVQSWRLSSSLVEEPGRQCRCLPPLRAVAWTRRSGSVGGSLVLHSKGSPSYGGPFFIPQRTVPAPPPLTRAASLRTIQGGERSVKPLNVYSPCDLVKRAVRLLHECPQRAT